MARKKVLVALLLITVFSLGLFAYTGSEVMLQGFNWDSKNYSWYSLVEGKVADMQASLIDMIWLPPPSDAASDEGYLPRELYKLDSKYGSQAQLKSLISALHSKGIKAIADIVINHRVGSTGWGDFVNPTWGTWSVCGDDEWPSATGNNDSGDGYAAARDLDHSNTTVQNDIKAWMNWMKNSNNAGFDGWRYDYVKGYWGGYNKIYNNATAPFFSVGELWPDINGDYYASAPASDYHRQLLVDWINATDGTSTAFDFTTKWQLQLALERNELWRMGSIPGLIGWWGARAVTFIDNHDTGSSQAHWPFPGNKVMQGYAYILTHPGIPSILWDHFYDWGHHDAIKALIKVRKDNGLTSTSSVSVQKAEGTVYAAIIDSKVAMKIGSGSWDPGYGWTIAASGTDYAVWTKSGGGGGGGSLRTVVFMQKQTTPGQDIFVKGGHDAGLVPSAYPSMAEPITYNNTLNTTTAAIKANDSSLDWGTESALDWTCNAWPASWGTKKTYAANGFGEDPENTWGLHWWKFDVTMTGNVGDWFEFKAFMREGSTEWWESDRAQTGTPYSTINHWGKKGYITRCAYNENWVEFTPLN